MKITDNWIEVPLNEVLQAYADGFTNQKGEIIRREYFIDTMKNIVLFKIVTQEDA